MSEREALFHALEKLVAACESAFAGDSMAEFDDDEDVSHPPSGITFVMIRQARAALALTAIQDNRSVIFHALNLAATSGSVQPSARSEYRRVRDLFEELTAE